MIDLKIYHHSADEENSFQQMLEDNLDVVSAQAAARMCSVHADSTGWFNTEEWAGEKVLKEMQEIADRVRKDAEVFVIIGVGGSNNSARSVIEAFPDLDGPEIVYAGCSLSPWAMNQVMKKIEGKSVYIDCIAKNFQTLEPGSSFRVLREYLYKTYGDDAAKRIIATGTRGSLLYDICMENGYTFVDFPVNVGGRYTAMTPVGLLPMAVAGIDIAELARGGHDMQLALHADHSTDNLAYRYAVARNLYYNEGYRVEMLSTFEPQMHHFYEWWIQLFAESEGKQDKGLYPVRGEFSEELHSVGQFIQDGSPIMFETFVHVNHPESSFVIHPDEKIRDDFAYLDNKDFRDINEAAYTATLKAHNEKLPCIVMDIDSINPYNFGQLFYFFMFACEVSAALLGVNPFDQEGVEAYKLRMFKALGK